MTNLQENVEIQLTMLCSQQEMNAVLNICKTNHADI